MIPSSAAIRYVTKSFYVGWAGIEGGGSRFAARRGWAPSDPSARRPEGRRCGVRAYEARAPRCFLPGRGAASLLAADAGDAVRFRPLRMIAIADAMNTVE